MLSIGAMAALCGTSVQTLRLYDKKGLLPAARIDPDSGYRYYTNGQIFLFQTIRLLQRTGMSLAEIRETLQKDPVDLRSLWDSQEKAILQKQQELHEMEIMVHQQQKQLEEASLMQQHAGKGPYIKRVSSTLLSLPIEKEGITPKVEPTTPSASSPSISSPPSPTASSSREKATKTSSKSSTSTPSRK